MSDRSDLIAKAASLPVGDPTRSAILKRLKVAVDYHGDPNVSLESVVYNAERLWVEDVAKAIIRYSSLKTPVEGKTGATFMRGAVAHGGLVNRSGGAEWSLGVEVKASGSNVFVELSSDELGATKKWKFPNHSSPASIGSDVSWVGKAYLLGETPR